MNNTIAVLDFGGQYAHLLTNRIRRLGVHSIIKPHNTPASELKDYSGIILSGGPQSVNAEHALVADPDIFMLNIPVLGICYGHQLTNKILGGKVSPGKTKEYGKTKLVIDKKEGIFAGIDQDELQVWMSHWDEVTEIPTSFSVLAHTDINDFAAVGNVNKNIYGIQFHPEVTHTEFGQKILENFVNLTKAEKTWSISSYLEYISQEILRRFSDSYPKVPTNLKVFMLVSGGVDSVVAFTLLNKVLGEERVCGLLVDTGFMRKGEIEEVMEAMKKLEFNNLHVYDAKQDFFEALKGISEPEKKRQIIGKKFIDIQEKVVHEMGINADHPVHHSSGGSKGGSEGGWLLGQGTIYPDTIESGGTKHADKIKTHHNRVPEIQELMDQGLVIEPLADLYKDEVRDLGEQLGLPHHLVWRHPFPGPGLAIRILCTPHKIPTPEDLSKEENKINEFLTAYELTGKILPIESVGVQGDARTYRHPLAISPVNDKTWQDFWDKEKLQDISTQLTNKFESINRVIFTLHGDAGSAVLIPDSYLTPERVRTIQEADKIIMDAINEFDLEEKMIWQCPTILLPLHSPDSLLPTESLVLRPVSSIDAMTADFALIPIEKLNNILEQLISKKPSLIFYDLTNKPPGTIEWE